MRALALAVCALAIAAPSALAQSVHLSGPDGTSLDKVLVIGTDGTRWDRVQALLRAGRAPNLARVRRAGFGVSSRLDYGPGTVTISEVGWSSIASGVWEDKHGIKGGAGNRDPGQATKNGFLDFLTRIEQGRPQLSTFVASDWDNIALPLNGGPIFGSAMDARFAPQVTTESVAAWDAGDEAVTREAARYLRRGDPDAGFVYLGVVDETAHLVGSARPAYTAAIRTTDGRIGRLLAALRARPSYPFESWTVLVTTDHGERPLREPSVAAHFGTTALERTVFVLGSGPGLSDVRRARVIDVHPTVLHQLGVPIDPAWRLDGRSLSRSGPSSSASASLRSGRLIARLRLGAGPRGARAVRFRLPAGVRASAAALRVNGRPVAARIAGRRTVTAHLSGGALRTLTLAARASGAAGDGALTVTLVRAGGATSSLSVAPQTAG